jgi:hypothetical protein
MGREGASHGERRSTAMAAGGEGRGQIGPHLRTNDEDNSRSEKQRVCEAMAVADQREME